MAFLTNHDSLSIMIVFSSTITPMFLFLSKILFISDVQPPQTKTKSVKRDLKGEVISLSPIIPKPNGSPVHEIIVNLPDDILIDILMRLSCADALRCKSVNKKFRSMISDPNFTLRHALCSTQKEVKSILHSTLYVRHLIYSIPLCRNQPQRIFNSIPLGPSPTISQALPTIVTIAATCNGLLLLRFDKLQKLYIFNPTTGSHRFIPYPFGSCKPDFPGLAVDINLISGCQFKVVVGLQTGHESCQFMTWKSDTGAWNLPVRECGIKAFMTGRYEVGQPVYVSGCLHWRISNSRILKYDVERGDVSLINLPSFNNKRLVPGLIGGGDGLLAAVLRVACANDIEIHSYDSEQKMWTLKESYRFHERCEPLFYDGEHLYVVVRRNSGNTQVVTYVYDKGNKDGRKLAEHDSWSMDEARRFSPCICNLLDVSNNVNMKVERSGDGEKVLESLSRLSMLLAGKYDAPDTFQVKELVRPITYRYCSGCSWNHY